MNSDSDHEKEIHSPKTFLTGYKNSFTSSFTKTPIIIEGKYKDTSQKLFNNRYYYHNLFEPHGGESLLIIIPDYLRKKLQDGEHYQLEGIPDYYLKENYLQICFKVSKILGQFEPETTSEYKTIINSLIEKYKNRNKDLDAYFKSFLSNNKEIPIDIIIGDSAIVEQDIYEGLLGKKRYFDITIHKASFGSYKEIEKKAIELDESDSIIAIVSGGTGSIIKVFNEPELSYELLNLNSFFITAIGHAIDHTWLSNFSDKDFPTPTSLGKDLKKYIEDYEKSVDKIEQARKQKINDDVRIQNLYAEKRELKKDSLSINESFKEIKSILTSKNNHDELRETINNNHEILLNSLPGTQTKAQKQFFRKAMIATFSFIIGVSATVFYSEKIPALKNLLAEFLKEFVLKN